MITRVIRIGANKGLETMACILSLPHQRGLRQLQERLRVDAHDERQNAAHAQRQTQAEATDSRYAEAAARDCPDVELVVERFIEPALARLAVTRGLGTVAFEAQEMTVDRHQALAALDGGPVLIPFGQAVEELRIVKDESEIALVARACAITSAACTDALGSVRPGVTEREFAIVLERAMTDRGAEALAFDTIVASGPNGAPIAVHQGYDIEAFFDGVVKADFLVSAIALVDRVEQDRQRKPAVSHGASLVKGLVLR